MSEELEQNMSEEIEQTNNEYSADSIQVLEGLGGRSYASVHVYWRC